MKRAERWLVLLACLSVGVFYFWTIWSTGEQWKPGKEQRDYYNLLIDGYLAGQLNMKVEVPDALLKLKDPYDPAQRPPGLGMHDASFYRGKYYVYFGAAPMVLLMLPFRVLTGVDLPIATAVMIFVYAGFLASVTLFLAIRRRYFPETSPIALVAGIFVLGLAGLGPVLLRRPDMWELPIAGGYCFAMLALCCVWQSLHSEHARSRWFGGAGLCLGLAVASRPTYLVASPFLAAPLVWWWWSERRVPWRPALRAAALLAVIGVAMAWHNYARFDHPLEFGQKYQFSLDYESKLPHFRLAYVPFTANAHFLSVAEWTKYYPFFHRALLGEAPAGFTTHRGDVYGLLTSFPITWLAALAPLALWRRPDVDRGRIGAWLASAALLFSFAAGLMLFFFSALARYQMDFAPTLLLLACVGLLGFERWMELSGLRIWRVSGRVLWIGAAIFSVGFGMVYSLGFDGLFRERNPRLEHKVARELNRVPAVLEHLRGVRFGPVEFEVRFPTDAGGRETLLTVGPRERTDRLFAVVGPDGRVQVGMALHTGTELISRPLTLASGNSHRVRVTSSSFYPSSVHPFFAGKSADEMRAISRRIEISVDGEPVASGFNRGAEFVQGSLRVGDAALADAAYGRFRGEISNLRRIAPPGTIDTAVQFVRVRFAFGLKATAEAQPLLALGESGSGLVLALLPLDGGQVRLQLFQEGAGRVTSEPLPMVNARGHTLDAIVRREGDGRWRILVFLDGDLAWAPTIDGDARFPARVVVGKNDFGFPDCTAAFGGEVFSVAQGENGRDPLQGRGETLRLTLKWSGESARGSEPLIVTGRSRAGDLLMVDYLAADSMQFVLDHWGAPVRRSPVLPIDRSSTHEVIVTLPSLKTVPDVTQDSGVTSGPLRVSIDGRVVWEENGGEFFTAEPEEITVGRNPIGGTIGRARFTGEILSVERVARE